MNSFDSGFFLDSSMPFMEDEGHALIGQTQELVQARFVTFLHIS